MVKEYVPCMACDHTIKKKLFILVSGPFFFFKYPIKRTILDQLTVDYGGVSRRSSGNSLGILGYPGGIMEDPKYNLGDLRESWGILGDPGGTLGDPGGSRGILGNCDG